MAARENKVERYLDTQVKKWLGGTTRKWVSPGVDGVPDRLVIVSGKVVMVEVKTLDGKLSPMQEREHDRLREHGMEPITVYGEEGVDRFINMMLQLLDEVTQ